MAQIGRWSRFGWQGVTFDVPADWDLARFRGTRVAGYAGLTDREIPRLEVRWEKAKRETPFEKVADGAARQISKDRTLRLERQTHMVELKGKDCETFTCRPSSGKGLSSYHMLSVCRECGRVVMLRIAFPPGENIKAIAKRVMSSMQDHSYDGADVWAAYGLEFAVPETVVLDQALIYPGSLDFRFEHRRDRIDVGRIALASVILKKMTLDEWFRSYARKRFKNIRYAERETELLGHRGLELTGGLKGFGALLPKLVYRQRYCCRLWYCDVSDKLCFFSVLAGKKTFERFSSSWSRVVCHR